MPSEDQSRMVTQAPSAQAANGYVLLDHPDGLAVTLTPSAALETAQRLRVAAAEARDQASLIGPAD